MAGGGSDSAAMLRPAGRRRASDFLHVNPQLRQGGLQAAAGDADEDARPAKRAAKPLTLFAPELFMQRRHAFITLIAAACVALPAAAQERGTRDEAKAMADAAWAHMKKVGYEQANKDFTTDKATWTKKDLYVIVFDTKGVFQAHGANDKLVGRDMSAMKDPNGKAIFPAMMDIAAKGATGWVDYDWAHPQTKKVEGKTTYVRKVPVGEGLIGVGIYR